jgi:acetolactate synthase-1/3 small subunit
VDVSHENVLIEISGKENKINAFIEAMREYGIVELVRTGRIAMTRGNGLIKELVEEPVAQN